MAAGRASNSPRSSSYGEDPRALPAIPDQLNALGLAPIPEDGLSSLGLLLLCSSLMADCTPLASSQLAFMQLTRLSTASRLGMNSMTESLTSLFNFCLVAQLSA